MQSEHSSSKQISPTLDF